MRRRFLLAIFATLLAASVGSAQQQKMVLVHGLRTNGLADLAMQYLDELKASNPPPEIAVILPLEYARTRLALAFRETEAAKREELIKKAKGEFDTFINSNPKHPQTPFANIDLARLISLRGKSAFSKARSIRDAKKKADGMADARKLYTEAATQFDKTLKILEGFKETPEVAQLSIDAKIDQAINLYDRGLTYALEELDDIQKRSKDFEDARKLFEKVMLLDDKNASCWVARVWATQCTYEGGDQITAKQELDIFLQKQRTNPSAQAGIRLARYFRIGHNFEKGGKETTIARYQRIIEDATNWLNTYSTYRNTDEGQGALFTRGTKRFDLAMTGATMDKIDKTRIVALTLTAKKLLEDSEKDFKELIDGDNEYSEQAYQYRTSVLITLADIEGGGDPAPSVLATFEKNYLRAQLQEARLNQFKDKKTPPKEDEVKAEENRRYANAIKYLEYAITVTTNQDSLKDIINAHLLLVRYNYLLKRYQHAAILAEHTARTFPKAPKASLAGQFAMQCYIQSLNALRGKENQAPEDIESETQRLMQVVRYVVTVWPNEPNSDGARHMLASQMAREKKYEESLPMYREIRTNYAGVASARLEMSSIYFTLLRNMEETDPVQQANIIRDRIKAKRAEFDNTIKLIEEVPPPDEEAAEQPITVYFNLRGNLALLYQLDEKPEKIKAIGEDLLALIPKLPKLKDAAKENQFFAARTIVLNALRTQAVVQVKEKNFAKVAEILAPMLEQLQKEAAKPSVADPPKTYRQSQRNIIIIALQSSVQDGKIDRGIELLDLLEKSGGQTDDNISMMRSLVSSVRNQLEDLKIDPKNAKEVENLKKGFTEFMQKIAAKSQDVKDEKKRNELKIFLAQGYFGVEEHAEAAKLLTDVRKDLKATKPADDAAKEAQEKQQRLVDFMLARNLRLGKKYPEAEALYLEIIGPADAMTVKTKRGWGFVSLDVRREYALLKEDIATNWSTTQTKPSKSNKWAEAFKEWAAVNSIFASNVPPVFDEKKNPPPNPRVFAGVLGGPFMIDQFNNMRQMISSAHEKKAESIRKRRAVYLDTFLDQTTSYMRGYTDLEKHKVVPADKVDGYIERLGGTFLKFEQANTDLSQEQKDRIKALFKQYPKLKLKYDEAKAGK